MKRIKITEAQAKRLKLINENTDPLSGFEHFCRVKAQEVDRLYSKINMITIGDIITNDINMGVINEELNKIENEVMTGNRKLYIYIKNMPEADLDLRIDKASDMVMLKLTPLQLVTMDLEKLQDETQETNLMNYFKHIKPIDISGIQS